MKIVRFIYLKKNQLGFIIILYLMFNNKFNLFHLSIFIVFNYYNFIKLNYFGIYDHITLVYTSRSSHINFSLKIWLLYRHKIHLFLKFAVYVRRILNPLIKLYIQIIELIEAESKFLYLKSLLLLMKVCENRIFLFVYCINLFFVNFVTFTSLIWIFLNTGTYFYNRK